MKLRKIFGIALFSSMIFAGTSCGKANAEASVADEAVAEEVNPANEKQPYEIKDNVFFNENTPLVVDFYADWCGPCKAYAPTFDAIAEKYAESACFVRIDADQYPDLCKTYEVSSIPTTLFIMPGGGLLGKESGILSPEQLETYVNQLIATSAGVDMEI